MENCPNCGQPMKLVPAGVSRKSGKPYDAFYSCKCGKTVNLTPRSTTGQRDQQYRYNTERPEIRELKIKIAALESDVEILKQLHTEKEFEDQKAIIKAAKTKFKESEPEDNSWVEDIPFN
jgi:hypothetical protein